MNILFLTLHDIRSVQNRGIYEDLIRELASRGHRVDVVSTDESGGDARVIDEGAVRIRKVPTGAVQQTGLLRKGVNTLLLGPRLKAAVRRHLRDRKYDLVLYPTPPITAAAAVDYVRRRDGARTFLLLKDIFPQNAVDIGMMTKTGPKGMIWRYFRRQEKRLYALSDFIGCMSPANVDYLLTHNPEIDAGRVAVCPNSLEPLDRSLSAAARSALRRKLGLPEDRVIFLYGGNLGRPQGIPFLMDCLRASADVPEAFFLVVGGGTEAHLLREYVERERPGHVKYLAKLPREEYDALAGACDVGLIFLDHRFTIPNFPSRLLSILSAHLPVLAVTDTASDVGRVAEEAGFGWWRESDDALAVARKIRDIAEDPEGRRAAGEAGWQYLQAHWTAKNTADTIFSLISPGNKEESLP